MVMCNGVGACLVAVFVTDNLLEYQGNRKYSAVFVLGCMEQVVYFLD